MEPEIEAQWKCVQVAKEHWERCRHKVVSAARVWDDRDINTSDFVAYIAAERSAESAYNNEMRAFNCLCKAPYLTKETP